MTCTGTIATSRTTAGRKGRSSARDARGIPVSCSDPSALALYEKALGQYQSYVGDPVATIEEALRHAPDFVLGHAFRATVLMTYSERRFAEQARVSVASAEALLRHANTREQALVAAARRLVDGDWDAACAAFDRVLVEDPRDAFAIQSAHLMDFYRGDALNLRNRISRVLPSWSPSVPGYSYILGMHAFGLEECNQYREAEESGRRALDLQPRDGWAVHAVTHVLEMQGRVDEGIAWLESREPDWAPDNGFAFHNYWHLALYYLDRQRHSDVLTLYDTRVHPEPPDFALQLLDATALLWRLFLEGVDLGRRADVLAKNWADRLETELSHVARHGSPLAVMLFDLDHFKRVNDTFGHLAGDHVLRTFAALVTSMTRREDFFARYGGEEFAMIGRSTTLEHATLLGERIRTATAREPMSFEGHTIPVTVSIGVAAAWPGCTMPEILGAADAALYAAKNGGRNRVIAYTAAR